MTPLLTASSTCSAGTTAPAGSISILSRPPVRSEAFLHQSIANSWYRNFAGQVLWNLRVIVAACALAIIGAARVVAPPAIPAARNLRRGLFIVPPWLLLFLLARGEARALRE